MGAVTASSCTNWNQDGTFTLTAQDGTRPAPTLRSRAMSGRGTGQTTLMVWPTLS
jgi:hypothetical protein